MESIPNVKAEVVEHEHNGAPLLVERLESRIKTSLIQYTHPENPGCEVCHNYGKNLACPPFSPPFAQYTLGKPDALIICYRVALEQIGPEVTEDRHKAASDIMQDMLYDELMDRRKKGEVVAGAGPCRACKTCSAEEGKSECRFPERRIHSLESMGVNLITLTETAFGFSLEWSDGTLSEGNVSAIGAVFY